MSSEPTPSAEAFQACARALEDFDRIANPVGMARKIVCADRISGTISVTGLPGTWIIRRAWLEAGCWLHDIRRIA